MCLSRSVFTVIALMFSFSIAFAEDKEVTIDELIELAPVVNFNNESIKDYFISIKLRFGSTVMKSLVAGKAPGTNSIRIYSVHDNAPIAVAANGKAAIYDPISSRVMLLNCTATFQMLTYISKESKKREFKCAFSIGNKLGKDEATNINIQSLLVPLVRPLELKKNEDDAYEVTGESESGFTKVVAVIKPEHNGGVLESFHTYAKGMKQPLIHVDKLDINLGVDDSYFEFPDEKLKKSGLTIQEFKDIGILDAKQFMENVSRALLVKMVLNGAKQPELVEAVLEMLPEGVSLDDVRARDRKSSLILKEVFKIK